MPVFPIIVGVALTRPPGTDEYRKVVVEARHVWEAKLIAAQIAECTSVMAVSTEWEPSFDIWCRPSTVEDHESPMSQDLGTL